MSKVMPETEEYVNLMELMDEDCPDVPKKSQLFEGEDDLASKIPPASRDYKSVYVHFRNKEDLEEFANLIKMEISVNVHQLYFPRQGGVLFDNIDNYFTDEKSTKRSKAKKKVTAGLFDHGANEPEWRKHWVGMPEYVNEENKPFHTITFKFRNEDDYAMFAEVVNQNMTEKTKSMWHPSLAIDQIRGRMWMEPNGQYTQPKYPLCTISKGRAHTMMTSRSLAKMHIHHYVAVEPQDYNAYEAALDKFGIREFATILELPFSNHGDGPGRARNWWWDYSRDVLGAEKHWVMDDNIQDFYRLHNNKRIRVKSGAMFKSCEDFVDRYDNVLMAGLQYRFFIAPDQAYPAYVKNTRIYSCNLIDNSCPWRWRGRYNEDTILSLDILTNGYCTIQFNHFLQGKAATQTVSGGNTAEFYHAEGGQDKEKWREGRMNAEGTINKSQMLVNAYPEYSELVWKYGRWHHYVDYLPFKKLKLHYKKGTKFSTSINNYNLELVKVE